MKNKLFIPISLFLLTSCGRLNSSAISTQDIKPHEYSEVSEKFIEWNQLFNFDLASYPVYIYSSTCRHCENIKDQMIEYSLHNRLYFIEYSSIIRKAPNIENTIGVSNIDDLFIKGTPTLLEIFDKKVVYNICGENAILDYLMII